MNSLMKSLMNIFKKIFAFFCGDWRIFWGIALTIVLVKLTESRRVSNLASLVILLLGVALSLGFSLKRETRGVR